MAFFLIPLTAFLASGLTFFSGFGLGTLLLPAFLLGFPPETAVALTAIVHFSNNLFKMGLMRRGVDWRVALTFGGPALLAAYVGAFLLQSLGSGAPLHIYVLAGRAFEVTAVKLTIAGVMAGFVAVESLPIFQRIVVPPRWLPLGGLLSGFFGGLSGHQGALRSMFLLKCGLSREAFIATGVAIAFLVDASRLSVYGPMMARSNFEGHAALMALSVLAALGGSLLGRRLLPRVPLAGVHRIVTLLLLLLAALLAAGVI